MLVASVLKSSDCIQSKRMHVHMGPVCPFDSLVQSILHAQHSSTSPFPAFLNVVVFSTRPWFVFATGMIFCWLGAFLMASGQLGQGHSTKGGGAKGCGRRYLVLWTGLVIRGCKRLCQVVVGMITSAIFYGVLFHPSKRCKYVEFNGRKLKSKSFNCPWGQI